MDGIVIPVAPIVGRTMTTSSAGVIAARRLASLSFIAAVTAIAVITAVVKSSATMLLGRRRRAGCHPHPALGRRRGHDSGGPPPLSADSRSRLGVLDLDFTLTGPISGDFGRRRLSGVWSSRWIQLFQEAACFFHSD